MRSSAVPVRDRRSHGALRMPMVLSADRLASGLAERLMIDPIIRASDRLRVVGPSKAKIPINDCSGDRCRDPACIRHGQ